MDPAKVSAADRPVRRRRSFPLIPSSINATANTTISTTSPTDTAHTATTTTTNTTTSINTVADTATANSSRSAVDATVLRERQQLDLVERGLLSEIHRIQARLAQARSRLTGNRQSRFTRPASKFHAMSSSADHTLGVKSGASTSRRADSHHVHRVISVSFRLPHNNHRASARQQLFDTAVPPKAALALSDAVRAPCVWVGSDPPDARSDPDELNPPRPGATRSRRIPSSPPPARVHHPVHRNVHVQLPLDPALMQRYHAFCEHILWRLLHYDYIAVDDPDLVDYWRAYHAVNLRFAEAVAEICEDGDFIWVHNFHLMLLPSMLRETVWFARIGFFLYTPFPSAELFRILPHRSEILRGVVGADLIGFHSYDHAKQFVTSARRLLGLEATPSEIVADPISGRTCKIGIYPGGIDVDALRGHVTSRLVKSRVAEMRARFEGVKLVVGIDRLDDCFAGLLHKLLAFERLLADNPHLVGKVVLAQVAMLPKEARSLATFRTQRIQLNECVARVNSAFGTWSYSPIHFINTPLDPMELLALMCVGHVCVVTTVRDAMNLIPHEWTVCQHGAYNGPIVLSEFASAAHSFSTALHVNPWDIDEVAAKIKVALDMGDTSRMVRNEAAYRFVTSHTAQQWGANFLVDLESVNKRTPVAHAKPFGKPSLDTHAVMHAYLGTTSLPSPTMSTSLSISANIASSPQLVYGEHLAQVRNVLDSSTAHMYDFNPFSNDTTDQTDAMALGASGFGNGAIPVPGGQRPQRLLRADDGWTIGGNGGDTLAQRTSRACLFILDIDGTLIPFHARANNVAVPQRVINAIQEIVDASPHNYVLLLSSRGRDNMLQTFGDMRVYLAAEDGAFFRTPYSLTWSLLFRDPGRRRQSPGATVYNGDSFASIPRKPVAEMIDERTAESRFVEAVSATLHNNSDRQGSSGRCSDERDRESGTEDITATASASTKASVSSNASFSSVEIGQDEPSMALSWKESVVPIMEHFVERTPGAILDEGEAIVTWHYDDTECDYGHWQSRQVCKHLESFMLRGLGISVTTEDSNQRWIRVRPKDADKTKALEKMVKHILGMRPSISHTDDTTHSSDAGVYVDFVLCIGDDRTDEQLFEYLHNEERLDSIGILCGANRIFTCRVGATRRTEANACLEGPTRVVQVLEAMCGKQAWAFL